MRQSECVLGTLSFEQTKLVSKFCNDISLLDEHIAFITVISRHGRQVDFKFRGDSPFSDLLKNESELVLMQRVLQTQMVKDFDDKLGKLFVSTIEREFCTECVFPFYDGVLLVVFVSCNNVHDAARKIMTSIKDFNFEIATSGVTC